MAAGVATDRQWRLGERHARVANRFERPGGAAAEGMAIQVGSLNPRPGGFTQVDLQEAFEMGRQQGRRGG